MIRTCLLGPDELRPHAPALRSLEQAISYPLDDGRDAFTLDHGPLYHPFFSDQGDARFLLAFDGHGGPLVGSGVGIFKPAAFDGRSFPTVYLCDVKVAPSHRGRGISHRIHGEALARALVTRDLQRFRLAWGVAMRGARGDVRRSWTGGHIARLGAPQGEIVIYFVDPALLAALDPADCPPGFARGILDLSPTTSDPSTTLVVSTAGKKDLRRVSTGAAMPLAHIPASPARCTPSYGHVLRAAGRAIVARHDASQACFSLDSRQTPLIAWLSDQGITTDTRATVLGLTLPGARRGIVHLATSDI